MSCKFCGKAFNRGYNLKDREREKSETESQAMDSGDDASTSSTDGSESPMTIDNERKLRRKKMMLGCQW